ncbi:hypothetical protein GCM10009851_36440 [Herbiconiux moechotypicola]|uniref:DUF4258 domain-containing protein n=1 Tax=Herbiconiux moechotypicola TaxID=637393 RepID=A0ABN3E3H5_9MICO
MEIRISRSAFKHGIPREDLMHALRHPLRRIDLDDGLTMSIGPSRSGSLLEVCIVTDDDGPRVIHAMRARRKFLWRP